jgi:hypothetical protein
MAMSRVSGFTLVAGGLAIGLYGLAAEVQTSDGASAVQAGIVTTSGDDKRPDRPVVVASQFSTPAAASGLPFSAPVVVTMAPRPSEPRAAPKAAFVPQDRDTLARELQKELRRVGCYEGALSGAWTFQTKQAMKAYLDRVNASLPVEEPDAVLYAMVQGQQDRVCGKPCPGGQGLSEDGRCVPNAILAKATKPTSPAPAPVVAHAPTADPPPAAHPGPAITGWSTAVTAAAPPPAPALASAPVGGRMALAGPLATDATVSKPAAAAPAAALAGKGAGGRSRPVAMAAGTARSGDWKRRIFEQP